MARIRISLVAALLAGSALAAVMGGDALAAAQQGGRSGGRQPRSTPRSKPARGAAAGQAQKGGTPLGAANGASSTFGFPAERQQRKWFSTADSDGTEWISFREASASMRFDAERFCIYDTDNDGRMTFAEYTDFVRREATLGHRIIEPIRAELSGPPPVRDAEQIRAAYDTDLDGAIDRVELDRILLDYQKDNSKHDTNNVLHRLDSNGNSLLDLPELDRLAHYLRPLGSGNEGESNAQPGARTVMELFGEPIDQGEAHAPRIVGPVPPFRRLDVDNNGYVDIEDLERLEGRTFSPVSLRSVLNTLDIDYDGRLSEVEFLAAMSPPR